MTLFKKFLILIFMALTIWGLLAKNQNDNETIEEAIDRKIAAHEADAEAHLSATGSLQSHKASEIIDHIAESIVNDKLYPHARAYTAIVSPGSDGDYDDIQSAVDYADSVGGGSVLVKRGIYNQNSDLLLGRAVDIIGDGPGETVITFGGAAHGVVGYQSKVIEALSFSAVTFTQGSAVVTFPAGTNLLDPSCPVWPGMGIDIGNGYDEYVIYSVDSATQITMTASYSGLSGSLDMYIRPRCSVAQGGTVVTFPAGSHLLTFGVESLFSFIEDSYEGVSIEISSVDSDTQLTLSSAYPGDYDYIFPTISELRPPLHNITDVSIEDSAAAYAVNMSGGTPVFVNNVRFARCAGLVYSSTLSPLLNVVSNNYFEKCSGPYLFCVNNGRVENNRGYVTADNVGMFYVTDNLSILNNRISGSGCTGLTILASAGRYLSLLNNYFSGVDVFHSGVAAATGDFANWRVSHNYISARSGCYLDFTNNTGQIVGNTLITSGGGRVRLTSDSFKLSFTANYLYYNYTNAGTGNIFAGNVYTNA